ncbi:MAG: TetR/AcrR family transcriptional regulator, partial [Parvularculaceae bacterium]|nr:TetR/AcrR family transcriptional regulator [Parvularculaceae bacterium]
MPAAARSPDQPKWRRRAGARPDEILDAALAEFSENGFEATRLDAVAARA